jgi:hypothetical protein
MYVMGHCCCTGQLPPRSYFVQTLNTSKYPYLMFKALMEAAALGGGGAFSFLAFLSAFSFRLAMLLAAASGSTSCTSELRTSVLNQEHVVTIRIICSNPTMPLIMPLIKLDCGVNLLHLRTPKSV